MRPKLLLMIIGASILVFGATLTTPTAASAQPAPEIRDERGRPCQAADCRALGSRLAADFGRATSRIAANPSTRKVFDRAVAEGDSANVVRILRANGMAETGSAPIKLSLVRSAVPTRTPDGGCKSEWHYVTFRLGEWWISIGYQTIICD